MAILKLVGFVGENPKVIPRLLGDMAAQLAVNTRLDDGGLTPIRKPFVIHEFADGGQMTILKHQGEWLGWDAVVYAVPGPVASDRLYIMGDGAPKMLVGGVTYPLSVPLPPSALTVTVTGVATDEISITRLYVYTWITEFGEESEPSPISADAVWKPGQSVTLSGFTEIPAGRNITKQRIYRSQTSMTGAQLFLIAERDASNENFLDDVPPESFQEALPSAAYNPPVDTLTGLTSMPNGMMAAFDGKDLYFCEPYKPHAWPAGYMLTTDYPIVGLGAFGTSLVIMTAGNLYVATGSTPESMVMEKLELNLPCVSARGIVDLGYSIAYPSHDGLVLVSSGGAKVVSETLFSRDEWLRMNPSTVIASQYDGRYYMPYNYIDENEVAQSGTMIIDLTGEQQFIIRADVTPSALFYETETGNLFFLDDGLVYQWDSIFRPFYQQTWKSKLFVMPKPGNFGAILIEADEALSEGQMEAIRQEIAEIEARNAVIFAQEFIGGEMNGGALNTVPVNGDLTQQVPTLSRLVAVNVYADRKLVATVSKINKMCRLPSGFLATMWEIEVVSDTPIVQVTMATTGTELMEV